MSSPLILVVDDEPAIREVCRGYLLRAGWEVAEAATGRAALELARSRRPALVVLDLMLPDIGGEDVCRQLRREGDLPVLMLTARADEESVLEGFRLGADDYLAKPFSPRELVARVAALLRRAERPAPAERRGAVLVSPDGALRLDAERGEATLDGASLGLTATEYQLLGLFLRHPGRLFSRSELVDHILGDDFEGDPRTIDAHIKNLRHKLGDDPKAARFIQTVHGLGYRLGDGARG